MTDLHDELHRLILRKRWIYWWLRTWRCDMPAKQQQRRKKLSRRLTRWKPTWEQRNRRNQGEMEE